VALLLEMGRGGRIEGKKSREEKGKERGKGVNLNSVSKVHIARAALRHVLYLAVSLDPVEALVGEKGEVKKRISWKGRGGKKKRRGSSKSKEAD